MAEVIDDADRERAVLFSGYGAVLERLSLAFSIAGGLVFVGLIGMSLVSIVGRKLASSPVQGDIELMQMGAAVGTAAFLPLCTLRDHHIKVDALTGGLPVAGRSLLDAIAQGLLFAVASVMAWRTTLAAIDTHSAGEMSPLLLIPQWIPVAMLVPSLMLFALCAAFRLRLSVQKMLRESIQ
jgi:TRAP-type C4-dicarboxylate transport system permease small subunit